MFHLHSIFPFKLVLALFMLAGNSLIVKAENQLIQNGADSSLVASYIQKSKEARVKYDFIRADLYLDTAMMKAMKAKNNIKLAEIYLLKGNVKKLLNDKGAALDFFIQAMNTFEQLNEGRWMTTTYVDVAEFYRKIANYSEGLEFIEKAEQTYAKYELNDLVLLNKIYNRAAAIYNEYNPDPFVSIKSSRKALKLAVQIPDSSLMAISYNELGYTYKNLLKVDSSEYFYRQAEKLWMSAQKYHEALHAMSNSAMLYLHNDKDETRGIALYQRIIHLSDSLNVNFPLINVSYALYQTFLKQGDTINAFHYFLVHHDETMIVYNTKTSNELHNVNARFQNEKIQNEYRQVSEQLNQSSKSLEENQRQQFLLILFLALLIGFLLVIIYLFFRLRKSNKDLAIKNNEKDTLIQEIHHRVKNNLQFISSLINMQVQTTHNDKDTESLNETSRRINAMALVHEMLYNKANQKGISAKYYLEELIDSLSAMVNGDQQNIDFVLDIEDLDLNVSDTISIGMITSELISNSMKHAFLKIEHPQVHIKLFKTADNKIMYIISDNGVGFKGLLDTSSTLGLRLVDIFSRQLKGTYTILSDKGCSYTLDF